MPGVEPVGAGAHSAHELVGVDQVPVAAAVGRPVEVLAREREAQIAGECAGPVAEAGRIGRLARVAALVEHGAGELAVVGPRAPIEVRAADARPHIVDHRDLRVDVDRGARGVLDVEHVYAVVGGLAAGVDGLEPADLVGRQRQAAVDVGVTRHDHDQVQRWGGPQRVRDQPGDVRRPHVLVLEVDQPSGPAERLREAAGHGAFAAGRVGGARADRWVGAQDLDPAGAGRRRVRGLLGQRVGGQVDLSDLVLEPGDRVVGVEGTGVGPALAESRVERADDGSAQLELDIVPGRVAPVLLRERHSLRVPVVGGVVAAGVAEVDAAGERDVALGVAGVAEHDELLVV